MKEEIRSISELNMIYRKIYHNLLNKNSNLLSDIYRALIANDLLELKKIENNIKNYIALSFKEYKITNKELNLIQSYQMSAMWKRDL